jgi:hypothetical protein
MAGSRTFSWMIRQKSVISLVGAEYRLMKQSGSGVLQRFYISAALILLIMAISACSIFYAVDILVHIYVVEILLASFLSGLFGLMYIFMMNTITKDGQRKKKYHLSVSNATRIGFVIFMAFIISKPIEIAILKTQINSKVREYRQSLIDQHLSIIDRICNSDINKLQAQIERDQTLQGTLMISEETKRLQQKILQLENKRQQAINLAHKRISASGFFIFQVSEAAKSPWGWLCCLVVMLLFITPGYLIYTISGDDAYFALKSDYETKMIRRAYASFERKYEDLFRDMYAIERKYYSVYDDPPFNTRRKTDSVEYRSEEDFFMKYLNSK